MDGWISSEIGRQMDKQTDGKEIITYREVWIWDRGCDLMRCSNCALGQPHPPISASSCLDSPSIAFPESHKYGWGYFTYPGYQEEPQIQDGRAWYFRKWSNGSCLCLSASQWPCPLYTLCWPEPTALSLTGPHSAPWKGHFFCYNSTLSRDPFRKRSYLVRNIIVRNNLPDARN